jgi:hypothetical protein
MAKVSDYSTALLPQEVIDLLDDVKTILNFGKYQFAVISNGSGPSWTGRQGEQVLMIGGGTNRLYVCTSDLSTTSWKIFIDA